MNLFGVILALMAIISNGSCIYLIKNEYLTNSNNPPRISTKHKLKNIYSRFITTNTSSGLIHYLNTELSKEDTLSISENSVNNFFKESCDNQLTNQLSICKRYSMRDGINIDNSSLKHNQKRGVKMYNMSKDDLKSTEDLDLLKKMLLKKIEKPSQKKKIHGLLDNEHDINEINKLNKREFLRSLEEGIGSLHKHKVVKKKNVERSESLRKQPGKFEEVLKSIEDDIKLLEKINLDKQPSRHKHKNEHKTKHYRRPQIVKAGYGSSEHNVPYINPDDLSILKYNLSNKIVDMLDRFEDESKESIMDSKTIQLIPNITNISPRSSNENETNYRIFKVLQNYVEHANQADQFQPTKDRFNISDFSSVSNNYNKILGFLNRKKLFNESLVREPKIDFMKNKYSLIYSDQIDPTGSSQEWETLSPRSTSLLGKNNTNPEPRYRKYVHNLTLAEPPVPQSEHQSGRNLTNSYWSFAAVQKLKEEIMAINQTHDPNEYSMHHLKQYANLFNQMTEYIKQKMRLLKTLQQFYEKNYINFLTDTGKQKKLVAMRIEKHFLRKEIGAIEEFLNSNKITSVLSNISDKFQERLAQLKTKFKRERLYRNAKREPDMNTTSFQNVTNINKIMADLRNGTEKRELKYTNRKSLERSKEYKTYDESMQKLNEKIWDSINFGKRDITPLKISTQSLLELAGEDSIFRLGWHCAMKLRSLYDDLEKISRENDSKQTQYEMELKKHQAIRNYSYELIPLLKLSISFRNPGFPFINPRMNAPDPRKLWSMKFRNFPSSKMSVEEKVQNWSINSLNRARNEGLVGLVEQIFNNKKKRIHMTNKVSTGNVKEKLSDDVSDASKYFKKLLDIFNQLEPEETTGSRSDEFEHKTISTHKIGESNTLKWNVTEKTGDTKSSILANMDEESTLDILGNNTKNVLIDTIGKLLKVYEHNVDVYHKIKQKKADMVQKKTLDEIQENVGSRINSVLRMESRFYKKTPIHGNGRRLHSSIVNYSKSLTSKEDIKTSYPLIHETDSFQKIVHYNNSITGTVQSLFDFIQNISEMVLTYQKEVSNFIEEAFKSDDMKKTLENMRVLLIKKGFEIAKFIDEIKIQPPRNMTNDIHLSISGKRRDKKDRLGAFSLVQSLINSSNREKINSTQVLLDLVSKMQATAHNALENIVGKHVENQGNDTDSNDPISLKSNSSFVNKTQYVGNIELNTIKRILNYTKSNSANTDEISEFQYILRPKQEFDSKSSINMDHYFPDLHRKELKTKRSSFEKKITNNSRSANTIGKLQSFDHIVDKIKNEKLEHIFDMIQKLVFLPEIRNRAVKNAQKIMYHNTLLKKTNKAFKRIQCQKESMKHTEDCKSSQYIKQNIPSSEIDDTNKIGTKNKLQTNINPRNVDRMRNLQKQIEKNILKTKLRKYNQTKQGTMKSEINFDPGNNHTDIQKSFNAVNESLIDLLTIPKQLSELLRKILQIPIRKHEKARDTFSFEKPSKHNNSLPKSATSFASEAVDGSGKNDINLSNDRTDISDSNTILSDFELNTKDLQSFKKILRKCKDNRNKHLPKCRFLQNFKRN